MEKQFTETRVFFFVFSIASFESLLEMVKIFVSIIFFCHENLVITTRETVPIVVAKIIAVNTQHFSCRILFSN